MGKRKGDDSDEGQMQIQQPVINYSKKKKIVKPSLISREANRKKALSTSIQTNKSRKKSIIKEFAKQVNLKTEEQSLEQKQQVFHRIIDELKNKKGQSKRDRKKNRVLLKKELNKALESQKIKRKRSKSIQGEGMEQQGRKTVQEGKKRRNTDDRQRIASFHQLMGAGLENIRNMVAKNISSV